MEPEQKYDMSQLSDEDLEEMEDMVDDAKQDEVEEEAKQEKVNLYAIRFAILSKMLKETYKVPYTHQQQLLKEHNSSMDAAIFTRLVSQIPQKLTIEA